MVLLCTVMMCTYVVDYVMQTCVACLEFVVGTFGGDNGVMNFPCALGNLA